MPIEMVPARSQANVLIAPIDGAKLDAMMLEIARLDFDSRYELIRRIQESVEAEANLTPEQIAELERRLDNYEQNPHEGYSHEDVLAYARSRR